MSTPDRRTRIAALPEAAGREELAQHIAGKTTMTVEQARQTLDQAPLTPEGHYKQGEAQARALLKPTSTAAAYAAAEGERAEEERAAGVRAAKAQADYSKGAAAARAALRKD